MPRVTLIHNPTAGSSDVSGDRLRGALRRIGYSVAYFTTDADLDEALQDPGDLVVAAGGDGTVGKVATRLIRRDVPLGILPIGTANNVATGLGIRGRADDLVEAWPDSPTVALDIGVAEGPWGVRHFVESIGAGLFADAMPVLEALKGDDPPEGPAAEMELDRRRLRLLLAESRARPHRIRLDGKPRTGEFLLVEILNVPRLGPGIELAPGADPTDGRLDVVLVGDEGRAVLDERLGAGSGAGELTPSPARSVELEWAGDALHLDGRSWGDPRAPFDGVRIAPTAAATVLRVSLEESAVPVLVPPPDAGG